MSAEEWLALVGVLFIVGAFVAMVLLLWNAS